MVKKGKKLLAAMLAVGTLFVGISEPVAASSGTGSVESTHLRSTISARRPLIGNARGTATVRRLSSNDVSAIRARVRVQQQQSGGTTWNAAGTGYWSRFDNPPRNSDRTTSEFIGTAHFRTRVLADGQRLVTPNGSWSTSVTAIHEF